MKICCDSIGKCCSCCGKCCDNMCDECGKCCDSCCSGFCKCIGDCCEGICKFITSIFQRPFSFCTFLSFFFTGLPFIFMLIGLSGYTTKCNKPIHIHLIIQGIINILNFIYCLYLLCYYNRAYQGVMKTLEGKQVDEKNILQRTKNMIYYDVPTCLFTVLIIFQIAWSFIGFSWISDAGDFCKNDPSASKMIQWDLIQTILTLVFVFCGGVLFLFSIIVYACDEGSCGFMECCRCLCLCLTCGCCDIGKPNKKESKNQQQQYQPQYQANQYQVNREKYSESRNDWLAQGKKLIGFFGFTQPDNQSQKQNQMMNPQVPQNQFQANNNFQQQPQFVQQPYGQQPQQQVYYQQNAQLQYPINQQNQQPNQQNLIYYPQQQNEINQQYPVDGYNNNQYQNNHQPIVVVEQNQLKQNEKKTLAQQAKDEVNNIKDKFKKIF